MVSKNSASGNFDGPLPPAGSFPEVLTNRETGFSPRKVSTAGRSKSLRSHTSPPLQRGKKGRDGWGGAGKGLVAFINRWNNLDAHPLTRLVTHPRIRVRLPTAICTTHTGVRFMDWLCRRRSAQTQSIFPQQTGTIRIYSTSANPSRRTCNVLCTHRLYVYYFRTRSLRPILRRRRRVKLCPVKAEFRMVDSVWHTRPSIRSLPTQ